MGRGAEQGQSNSTSKQLSSPTQKTANRLSQTRRKPHQQQRQTSKTAAVTFSGGNECQKKTTKKKKKKVEAARQSRGNVFVLCNYTTRPQSINPKGQAHQAAFIPSAHTTMTRIMICQSARMTRGLVCRGILLTNLRENR